MARIDRVIANGRGIDAAPDFYSGLLEVALQPLVPRGGGQTHRYRRSLPQPIGDGSLPNPRVGEMVSTVSRASIAHSDDDGCWYRLRPGSQSLRQCTRPAPRSSSTDSGRSPSARSRRRRRTGSGSRTLRPRDRRRRSAAVVPMLQPPSGCGVMRSSPTVHVNGVSGMPPVTQRQLRCMRRDGVHGRPRRRRSPSRAAGGRSRANSRPSAASRACANHGMTLREQSRRRSESSSSVLMRRSFVDRLRGLGRELLQPCARDVGQAAVLDEDRLVLELADRADRSPR